MRFTKLDRSEFASMLEHVDEQPNFRPPVRLGEPEFSPESRLLWVCWDDESIENDLLPRLVVVADDDLNDFLAWAVTFLPAFRPLTSFVRVLPWSVYSASRESQHGSVRVRPSVFLGAILGETLMNATGRGFVDSLPITAFETTYFAALGQAMFLGASPRLLQFVDEGWHFAREITEQRTRRVAPDSLEQVSRLIFRMAGFQDFGKNYPDSDVTLTLLEEACREIQSGGSISGYLLERLSGGRIPIAVIADSMRASKERRVEAFEQAAKILVVEAANRSTASFLVGYLASLISDGSLEHAHLVFPVQDRLPTAMLWYGICAGLSPNNRIQSDYSHLGLRIRRLLSRDEKLISSPTCDISIHELVVLLRGDPRARGFRQTHSSFLRVEIAPLITTVVKWPGRFSSSGQMSLFGSEEKRQSGDPERLNELIRTLRGSLAIAEGMTGNQQSESKPSSVPYRAKRRTK